MTKNRQAEHNGSESNPGTETTTLKTRELEKMTKVNSRKSRSKRTLITLAAIVFAASIIFTLPAMAAGQVVDLQNTQNPLDGMNIPEVPGKAELEEYAQRALDPDNQPVYQETAGMGFQNPLDGMTIPQIQGKAELEEHAQRALDPDNQPVWPDHDPLHPTQPMDDLFPGWNDPTDDPQHPGGTQHPDDPQHPGDNQHPAGGHNTHPAPGGSPGVTENRYTNEVHNHHPGRPAAENPATPATTTATGPSSPTGDTAHDPWSGNSTHSAWSGRSGHNAWGDHFGATDKNGLWYAGEEGQTPVHDQWGAPVETENSLSQGASGETVKRRSDGLFSGKLFSALAPQKGSSSLNWLVYGGAAVILLFLVLAIVSRVSAAGRA